MKTKLFIVLFLFICLKFNNSLCQISGLYINEFMASNSSIEIAGHSNNDDWIELRNTTSFAIDISGYYITDNLADPTKVRLPVTPGSVVVPANGFLVIICSDNPSLGARHIVLGLSASGESIGLYAADGTTLVDSFTFGPQRADVSMGRNPDNISEWRYFSNPTPGVVNNTTGMYSELVPAPSFSHLGGVFSSSFSLNLTTDVPEGVIYYTVDGSEPSLANLGGTTFQYKNTLNGSFLTETMLTQQYTSPITIVDRSSQPNKLSVKSSSLIDGNSNFYFPKNPVSKGTVVKAMVVTPNGLPQVATNTYFVFPNPNRYTLPIVSVSMDESKMFDYTTGFYTYGSNYAPLHNCPLGNYSVGFRHPGHFEYFVENSKVIDREVVYRIHGGCSRTFPRKTLRVLGGSGLDYPIFERFPERNHRNLLLRNSGNNWDRNLFKDVANHKIMDGLKFGKQESVPSVVFINGEYWGLHNIRERIDQHYISEIYGVNKDSVDIVSYNQGFEADEGDLVKFNDLRSFLNSKNFSNQANYDSLKNLIDIENFIDYQLAQIFINNSDWPFNNTRLWRKKTNYNPSVEGFEDGRWRWILYDTDLSVGHLFNSIEKGLGTGDQYVLVFEKALQNSEFRRSFITRFADILNTNFLPSRTTAIVDEYLAKFEPEIAEHIERWNAPTLSDWNFWVNDMRDFLTLRPEAQRGHIKSFFSEAQELRGITVNVSNFQHGYIKVNTIDILPTTPGVSANPYPWSGIYYQGVPVILKALSKKGGKFTHWLRNGTFFSSNPSVTVSLSSSNNNPTYTAVYEEDLLSDNPFPVAKILDECGYELNGWSSTSAAGTHPANMAFVYFDPSTLSRSSPDHILSDTLGGFTSGGFSHTNRSRVNGLDSDGVAFINTGGPDIHPGYPYGKIGGALLALNTLGKDSVFVSWTGGTVLPNSRDYAIRLQYRRGDKVDFQDLLNKNNQPVEYVRSALAGHYTRFEEIKLPNELMNEPYVQLLWRYYYKGQVLSGSRAQLRLDDIKVYTKASYAKGDIHQATISAHSNIISKATVIPTGLTEYKAKEYILLEPGFNTSSETVFKAGISNCL